MSEFKFSCPHCDQHLQCSAGLGGRQTQCPACNHLIVVPSSPARLAAGNLSAAPGKTWNAFIPPAVAPKDAPAPPQG
jgi:hypothetical protein